MPIRIVIDVEARKELAARDEWTPFEKRFLEGMTGDDWRAIELYLEKMLTKTLDCMTIDRIELEAAVAWRNINEWINGNR